MNHKIKSSDAAWSGDKQADRPVARHHHLSSSSSSSSPTELDVLARESLHLLNYVFDNKETESKIPQSEDLEEYRQLFAYSTLLTSTNESMQAHHSQKNTPLSANNRRPWKRRKKNPTVDSILFELDPVSFNTVIASSEKRQLLRSASEEGMECASGFLDDEDEEGEMTRFPSDDSVITSRQPSIEEEEDEEEEENDDSSSSSSSQQPIDYSMGASPLTFYTLMTDIQRKLNSPSKFEHVADAMRLLTNEQGQRVQRVVFSEEELQYQLRNEPALLERVRAMLYQSPGSYSSSKAAEMNEAKQKEEEERKEEKRVKEKQRRERKKKLKEQEKQQVQELPTPRRSARRQYRS